MPKKHGCFLGRWASVFSLFLSTPLLYANTSSELTVYFIPAPVRLNWLSPDRLVGTVVSSALSGKSHTIGHASLRLRCAGAEETLAGMTTETNSEEQDLLLKEQIGLGILFHTFRGKMERSEDLKAELDELSNHAERLAFLKILISDSTCARIQTYLREYKSLGVDQRYGLPHRPRFQEGAGCTAFVTSALEVGGLFRQDFDLLWSQERHVPESLIGDPATGKKVSVWDLLTPSKPLHWGMPFDGKSRAVRFWDPDKMYDWVQWNWKISAHPGSGGFESQVWNRARGIQWDARKQPAPSEPIWK